MRTVILIVTVVVLLAAIAYVVMRMRPRRDDGLTSFRRHIDALSPEARREVQERARRNEEGRD